jgi:hypothetical protein
VIAHDHVDVDRETREVLNKHVDGGTTLHGEARRLKNVRRNRQREPDSIQVLVIYRVRILRAARLSFQGEFRSVLSTAGPSPAGTEPIDMSLEILTPSKAARLTEVAHEFDDLHARAV